MSWFKRTPKVPKELLRYDRRPIRYTASVDDNGVTTVLGKGGSISILNGELIVTANLSFIQAGRMCFVAVYLIARQGSC